MDSRSKQLAQGAIEQNPGAGAQAEDPRGSWSPGNQQHPEPENQDSQHKLHQARESFPDTINTEIKTKRNNIISELISFRITKAKSKVKFGVKYLCKH